MTDSVCSNVLLGMFNERTNSSQGSVEKKKIIIIISVNQP